MVTPRRTRPVIAVGLALILLGCAKPNPPPGQGTAAPTGSPAPPPATADTAEPAAPAPGPQAPPGTGVLPPPPTTPPEPEAPATGPAGGVDRSKPDVVAKAYAAGLFTVDWTKPLPTTQKLAATTPWAVPAVTAKLTHGQNYQPDRTDPRVAAGQRDTVERVDVEPGDPELDGATYVVTVHVTTSTATRTTTGQAVLVLHLTRTGGQWLVDDTRLVT